MRFAFCIFKYFPHGGVQRNLRQIALECLQRGHKIDIFTLEWRGDKIDDVNVHVLATSGWSNHRRYQHFWQQLDPQLQPNAYDAILGFNKIPGLDLYYAGDPCFLARSKHKSGGLYQWTGRFRQLAAFEKSVFAPTSPTHILLLSPKEKAVFQQCYATPDERFAILPPGIDKSRLAPDNAQEKREHMRQQLGLDKNSLLVLLIGSGFKTKGLDRALCSFAALPDAIRQKSHFMAVGEDNRRPFERLARRLGIHRRVTISGGRDDITSLLLAGDVLLHPAYAENTGNILLEAMGCGLPVITTDVCGYAFHVQNGGGGQVIASPFQQNNLNQALLAMLTHPDRQQQFGQPAMTYVQNSDLFRRPQIIADLLETTAINKKNHLTFSHTT